MKTIIKNNYKLFIYIGLIILLLLLMVITNTKLANYKNKKIPEVKLKDIKPKKSLAIMITNDNGIGYKEYEDNTWPSEGYKFKEAKCIDNNGTEVKEAIKYAEGKITLTTNKTIYCTVYFDKPIIAYLRSNDSNNNLSSTIQGDMYRYQGTKDKVDNNYICFGTNNQEECKNDQDHYMYRIIGIDENDKLKLIKETFIKEGDNRSFVWNDTYRINTMDSTNCPDNKCPDWPESKIFKRINGISNGDTVGSGQVENGGNTDIFVDSKEYSYLKSGDGINGEEIASDWYNLIENHEWLYGETKESDILHKYNAKLIYQIESGNLETWHTVLNGETVKSVKYNWTQTTKAKISLMYWHDFLYSYYNKVNEETTGKEVSDDSIKNSWLYFGQNSLNQGLFEWLSVKAGMGWFDESKESPVDDLSWENYQWVSQDMVTWAVASASFEYMVGHRVPVECFGLRPVFYLNKNIALSGNGTNVNPYIINF